MEQADRLARKLDALKRAVSGFRELLGADLLPFSPLIIDGIKSGQVQKFESCAELLWKPIAAYLSEKETVAVSAPKSALKAFFQAGKLTEAQYALACELQLPVYARLLDDIIAFSM